MTKFVAVKFKPEDSRTYTYSWDGPDLFPGDRVKVADNRDPSAWKRVTVVSVSDEAPPFACKPIIGRVEDVPAEPDVFQVNDAPIDRDGLDPVVQF